MFGVFIIFIAMERILLILDGGQLRVETDWDKYIPKQKKKELDKKKKNGEDVKEEEKSVSTFYHSASTVCGKYTVVDMDKTSAQPIVRSLLRQINVLPEIAMLERIQIGVVVLSILAFFTLFASMSDNQKGLDEAEKRIIDKIATNTGAIRLQNLPQKIEDIVPQTYTGSMTKTGVIKNPFIK